MGEVSERNTPNPTSAPTNDGVEGGSGLLKEDEFALKKDVALMRRAVRERWGVPAARRKPIVDRMCDIAENHPDDELAVSTARVLVSMDAADTQAFATLDKTTRLDTGQATENVAVRTVRYVIEEAAHEQPAPPPTTPPENPD